MAQRTSSSSSRTNALGHFIAFCILLFFGHSASLVASTGISLVQHRSKDGGTNTTASVAFQNPNTAGNFIAVAIRGGLSSSQVFTVKDSNGNIYKKAVQIGFTSSAVTSAVYYAENIKGGANTVTVSMTVSAPLRFAILEYSGVASSNSLDATAAATGTGTAVSSGSATTTINGDLLFGSASTVDGANYTAGTGYTIRDSVPSGAGAKLITEDGIQTIAGTASATATLAASGNWGAVLAAFKPAGGVASPSISSLNPASGPVGASVTIAGANFGAAQGTSTVTFNGTAAAPTSWSNASITVPVPVGATSGNVVVTVGGFASNGTLFTVIVPPSITNLSPTFAPLGSSVTISGSNFGASQGTSTVTFNGAAATPTSWSTTSITAPVPSGATSGNVIVTVSGLASNGVAFGVAPSITSISPTSGPIGTSVTITGTSFGVTQGTSTVTFGANTATPTSWSNTTIVVPVPAGATTGNVIVMVNGIGSNRVLFTVTPVITSLNPTSGPAGTSVTITGSSFGSAQGSSTVAFNGTAATPASWSATSIVVPVPSGATTGNVVVNVGGLASNSVPFTVTVPPSITSLSPTSGPVGTSVTITGSNFGASQGASTVTFNGTTTSPTGWSATSIVVPVPSGATTGNVVVTVSALASNSVPFTVLVPPSIASLSPTSGPVGTSITITGTNFGATQGTSTITLSGTQLPVTSWTSTSIATFIPAGAATGNVVATVGGLASNGVLFTVTPSINSISPTSGPAGTSVTIAGANFGSTQGTSSVMFGSSAASVTSWSNASIVAIVPSDLSPYTNVNVQVTVSGASASTIFSITPNIASVSPTVGPAGTSVTITGTNFTLTQGTNTVTFNGAPATPTSWSPTSIVVPVPAGATTGNVVVTVNGFASNAVAFTVLPTPNITSLSPASGPLGTSVTITGTNFGSSQGTSTVTFSSAPATPTSWSATSIIVPVPSGATTGNVVVTVGGVASNAVAFTVIPPNIAGLSPSSGAIGTSVTITGSNFGGSQGTSTVAFNGTAATPTTWSATSIVVPVPNGATTGNVVVTVGALSSNGVLFTVTVPPTISSLSPTSASVGTSVTISGTNFGSTQGASTVAFNGTAATPTSWSSTGIVVPVPVGATTGNVVVTVSGLASNGAPFTVIVISVSVSPTAVTLGTGASQNFSATVQNDALGNGVTWSLSGSGCTGTACGSIKPNIAAPGEIYTAPTTAPNPATVTLTATSVTDPTKSASATITVVQATAPNVTGLSPSSGPLGASVTITGTNFGATQGSSVLSFNSTQGVATSWSNTSIVATVPTSLTGNANALIQVVVLGLASNQVNFSITPAPSITSLNPSTGPVGSTVTIGGNYFGATQGTSTVAFNGTLATPTSWSATSIVVSVPTGATTGNVVVTLAGVSSNGMSFMIGADTTPPTAPTNLTATASSAGEIDLYWTASTDNVGVSGYQVERCQGTGCTNFTLFTSFPEPNVPTSMSDVSAVGSTSYSYRVRATDAAGNLSAYSNIASATTPGAATITSLNPVSGAVGTSVTITGTGFGTAQTNSTVSFNGTQITFATSWSDTSIVLTVPSGATTGNVVVIVGSLPSNGVNFTVTPPPPPPGITSLSPSFAVVGGAPLTLTVNGTNFVPSSTVQWNGSALPTTFISSTQLQATASPANIASAGAAKVTVSNGNPGGGVSSSSTFFVGTTGGSNFATIVVNQAAQDIVYDPVNQVFYLSVPGTSSTNPNTIAVLDPATATITSTQPTGNNPNVLAISDDSQFLYAGIDGTSTVQRFILPGLTPDISYPLGSNFFGPFFALDLQVAPSASHTTAVSLGNSGTSPAAQGGVTIFDDATPRATNAPGGSNLFGSIQWGADGATLFASNTETSSYDFYTLTVNSGGVTLNQDFQSEFDLSGNFIHFDRSTNLIYSDDGQVINPGTGLPVGNFNATRVMVADAALNAAFFANTNASSEVTMASFDLTHFTPINSVTLTNVSGQAGHLIRWGQNGLAFINNSFSGTSQIVLVGGDFVSAAPPFVSTPPPAPVFPPAPGPNAPTIGSLNPSSSVAGSAAFVLNVTGTQFDPAATVQFNGSALSTTYVSSTQLQALIPASAVASLGTASVVVANPSASGGNSGSATFFVGSTGGTSSTGAGFAAQIVNLPSKQIAFDAASQRFYLSVPNSAATGNTIAVLDPTTASIIGQQFAGSNPDAIAISDDGQYLYAGIDGSSSVQRFQLPGLATDISYSLGAGPYPSGPFFALDLQVAPGSPHTTAVTRGAFNSGPQATGGIEIFDDASARPVIAKGFGSGGGGTALYDSLQWGADATVLFASNTEDSQFDFYTLSVTASGVSQTTDTMNAFSSFRDKIHFDRGTQLIYADDGQVLNPSTGVLVGTFSVSGPPVMVPDSSLNLAFFAIQTGSSSVGIYSFNLSTFAPVSSITISNVNGNPIRLIRWGQNGLALNTDAGQIVLVGGNFVH